LGAEGRQRSITEEEVKIIEAGCWRFDLKLNLAEVDNPKQVN